MSEETTALSMTLWEEAEGLADFVAGFSAQAEGDIAPSPARRAG